jgi:hypothetical protein
MLSRGNWSQYLKLKEDNTLCKYLLETELLTKESLFKFLNLYNYMLIKPCFGYGSIFVHALEKEYYEIDILSKEAKITVKGEQEVCDYLYTHVLGTHYYLIQQIHSFEHSQDSIVDYTITLHQEMKSVKWRVVTKVPYKENRPLSLFRHILLDYVCTLIGNRLEELFPNWQTILVDVGYDKNGKLWILHIDPQFPSSKWSQYQLLKLMKKVSLYLPATQIVTPYSIFQYLTLYQQIILKPCVGQWGQGVIQVTALNDGCFEIHFKRKRTIFQNKNDTLRYLEMNFFSKKRYLVQQKIQLAQINGNPFDVRIMVQRKDRDSPWWVTGRLIKVASNNFIITNVAKSVLTIEEGLQNNEAINVDVHHLINEIDQICLLTATHLGKINEELYSLGYDIGVTENGEAFIIEVNFKPDISMFKLLKDETIYQTIVNERKNFRRSR